MDDAAQPFSLPGGPQGVLLIHGFTGTPHEMRSLGERLHRAGMTVSAVRLHGHGGTVEALEQSGWPDWLESCEAGLADLEQRCTSVHLAGFSMGGALSLLLAHRYPGRMTSLAIMATPLWLPFYFRWPLLLIRRAGWEQRLRPIRKIARGDIRDREQRLANISTPAYPLRATLSLIDLLHHVRPALEQIPCPTLVIHSKRDHTAPYACSGELVRRLPRARRMTLRRSFHVIPMDVEREEVAREIEAFYRTSSGSEETAHAPVRPLD